MSHFAVAVLTDGTKTVSELLEPYQEHNVPEPVDEKYLVFVDTEEENRAAYDNGVRTFYHINGEDDEDEALVPSWSKAFRKPDAPRWRHSSSDYEVPEGTRAVEVPLTAIYPTFDDYMREYLNEDRDAETGRYGYWENPNAKWDWYEVGGRWTQFFREMIGGVQVRVGGIKFDPEKERRKAEKEWEEQEGHPLWQIRCRGLSKEQYIESAGYLSFRACVTPDGEWHEVGKMGWWGMSSESADELLEWEAHFAERFLGDPNLTLTVVDCHI